MTEERETEIVAGTVGGIIQKASDKWQVEVTPEGSQYAKKLWTKSAGIQETFAGMFGQQVRVLCNVSHWTNQDGQPVRSLWIDTINPVSEATGGSQAASQPSGRAQTAPSSDATRESIERQVALKASVEFWGSEGRAKPADVIQTAEVFDAFLARGRTPVSALAPDEPPDEFSDVPF